MFSYYGSKSKIVDLYPPPKYDKIIEPFAGSARYSLKYWQKDILIVDKYELVVKIWRWLQQCSKDDILKLPKMRCGDDIRNYGLSECETLFLSFISGGGVNTPKWTVSKFGDFEHGNQNVYKRIANSLHKIRHWNIIEGSYDEIENHEATWFIDPPYQVGGHKYYHNKIDYHSLSKWCELRKGQVIVCENMAADWMIFKPLRKIQGVKNTNTVEAIWSNHVTNYDNVQMVLF